MSQFYIGSESPSTENTPANIASPAFDSDEEDTLPYPEELARNDFLAPDFEAQTYLSSLKNRHQTLEDLRTDLRQRSQLLNRELLDLVNGNYEEFLSLGEDLKGGDERVEGVKVGLLGFQREVEGIRKAVRERAGETRGLLEEKKALRREVVLGRALLGLDESLEVLEERLGLRSRDEGADEDDLDEDDEEGGEEEETSLYAGTVRRLQKQSEQYLLIRNRSDKIGSSHPFIATLTPRLEQVRKTLLIDLSSTLRQAKAAKDSESVLALSRTFGTLDAESEALKVLRGT